MLLEFSVANFKSFKERQTFSLVKNRGKELSETNTFSVNGPGSIELLRSSSIYGPNASGKSNLLQAVASMRSLVLTSSKSMQRGDFLDVVPFKLDPNIVTEPSEFEVIFIANGVRYQYGFTATRERVLEEWLFTFPKGNARRMFARTIDPETGKRVWKMGRDITGEKNLWKQATRDNSLFLSTAVQLNSETLKPVFDWFSTRLRISSTGGWINTFTATLCASAQKKIVLDFLKAADLGIEDVVVEHKPLDLAELQSSTPDGLKTLLENLLSAKMEDASSGTPPAIPIIRTVHQSSNGEQVSFELSDESDGTQKIFALAGPWIDSLKNGYVLFIDELHIHLHPKLVSFLVGLFHSNKYNRHNAQLIFTTHDTTILSQEIFRRDQIWFCEKNQEQATQLIPLTDFHPRKGRENIESAYLSGRYGALPFVGQIKDL